MANLSSTVPSLIPVAPLTLVTIQASKPPRYVLQPGDANPGHKVEGFSRAALLNATTDPLEIESAFSGLDGEPPVLTEEAPLFFEEIADLVHSVKLKHGVDQVRHVIARVGCTDKLMSIPPPRFAAVKKACKWLLDQPRLTGTRIYLMHTTGEPLE